MLCEVMDRPEITFSVLEGKNDSSLDDFSSEVSTDTFLLKNRQDLNRFSPL